MTFSIKTSFNFPQEFATIRNDFGPFKSSHSFFLSLTRDKQNCRTVDLGAPLRMKTTAINITNAHRKDTEHVIARLITNSMMKVASVKKSEFHAISGKTYFCMNDGTFIRLKKK